jgi:hypothetical protein
LADKLLAVYMRSPTGMTSKSLFFFSPSSVVLLRRRPSSSSSSFSSSSARTTKLTNDGATRSFSSSHPIATTHVLNLHRLPARHILVRSAARLSACPCHPTSILGHLNPITSLHYHVHEIFSRLCTRSSVSPCMNERTNYSQRSTSKDR